MKDKLIGLAWLIVFLGLIYGIFCFLVSRGHCEVCENPAAGVFFDTKDVMHVACRKHAIVILQTEEFK